MKTVVIDDLVNDYIEAIHAAKEAGREVNNMEAHVVIAVLLDLTSGHDRIEVVGSSSDMTEISGRLAYARKYKRRKPRKP